MLILLATLSFLTVAGLVVAAAMLIADLRRSDEHVARRLGLAGEGASGGSIALAPQDRPGRIDRWFYRLVETSGSRLDAQSALALVAGLAVAGAAVPLVLIENPLVAAAGLLLATAAPLSWWTVRGILRFRAMQKALPDTLEMLAEEVRAGQTLEQAAAAVAGQGPEPLRTEFQYCAAQFRLGHSPVAVLERMARRIPVPEFKIFTTAVMVHRQTGGNLALLAERLARSARDRSEVQGHVRAVTAGSRFSVIGLTLGTLLALAMLASLRPEYLMAFRDHAMGVRLLVMAGALQVVGILWVARILRVTF